MSESDSESDGILQESDNLTEDSDSDTEPLKRDSTEEDTEETDSFESNDDESRKLATEFEKKIEAVKKEIMDIQRSRANTDSDTEEDDDIDDHEDPTDEGKYSAPEFLRKHIDKVVDEISNIVARNANERYLSKESRRSSIGRNTITARKSQSISEEQKEIAEKILDDIIVKKIPEIISQRFQYFDMFIIVPYFHSLGKL